MEDPVHSSDRLRVAAISFLNPAPLLWNFEHDPAATDLRRRYDVRYTLPSRCAAQLASGEADLGLIPIAALPYLPDVRAIPGCTIASLHQVRSIQLVLRPGVSLFTLKTVAADAASRSSAAYIRVMLRHFYRTDPLFHQQEANLESMLKGCEGALLIGDPALLALQQRDVSGAFAECTWIDVATLWRQHTGLPWVAAVWAVRQEALERCGLAPGALVHDLAASRDVGMQHVEDLVTEWHPRLGLDAETIRTYLTKNIHYHLDAPCLEAIACFFRLAHATAVLPLYHLQML